MKAIAMDEHDWRRLAAAPDAKTALAARFPALMRETRDSLYATLKRIVRSDEDAEDLLQDTYLRALSRLDSYRGEGSPEAWLRRIAVRLALNHLRSRRLRRMLPWPLPSGEDGRPVETEAGAEHRPGPDADAQAAQRRRRLEDLLAAHPAKAQAAFALRHLEDRPYAEIAELIGASEATTRSLVSRTVSRLEWEIRERGWSDD
jgi:RNA polymerase sigma factor (sigma-70 family)